MTANDILTPSNITFVLGIIAIIFSVYSSFKNPQDKLKVDQLITKKDVENRATVLASKEAESKAALLAQQVTLKGEENDKKFEELSERLKDSMTLAQNHIHTVDTKVDGLINGLSLMRNDITRLATIIEERMPRK